MWNKDRQWNIVLPWMLATVAGLALGVLSVLTIVTSLALARTPTALVGLIGGAGLGAGVGLAQWLVLRRHIPHLGRWALVSVVGGMIGASLGLVLSNALLPLFGGVLADALRSRPSSPTVPWSSALSAGLSGAVIGGILGGAQWSVLRKHVRFAGWWVGVNCLSWFTGLSLSAALIDRSGIPGSLLVAGIVIGATTGILLVYLLPAGTAPTGQGEAA